MKRSPQDVITRLDALIAEIRSKHHAPCLNGSAETGDVLLVAHGHILRAFAMRWTGKSLEETALILEAGGVGTLRYACFHRNGKITLLTKTSYEHRNIDEPAVILGGGFVVDS